MIQNETHELRIEVTDSSTQALTRTVATYVHAPQAAYNGVHPIMYHCCQHGVKARGANGVLWLPFACVP